MKSLKELVDDPKVYEAVVQDSTRVLDEEVAKRSGITGLAIKAAYKLLKSVKGGSALRKVIEGLMPDFIVKLDPYFQRFQKEGKGTPWIEFLRPHFDSIADDLLSVTDEKSRNLDSKRAQGTYNKLRPKAKKEVVSSLPALARMMGKYLDT